MKYHELEQLGKALFPSRNWKARVAQLLDVDKQTVARWADPEQYNMPASYHGKIITLAEEHKRNLENVLYRLRGYKIDE